MTLTEIPEALQQAVATSEADDGTNRIQPIEADEGNNEMSQGRALELAVEGLYHLAEAYAMDVRAVEILGSLAGRVANRNAKRHKRLLEAVAMVKTMRTVLDNDLTIENSTQAAGNGSFSRKEQLL